MCRNTAAATILTMMWLTAVCGAAPRARAQIPQIPAPAAAAWHNLAVPGGVAALLDAAGLDPGKPRTHALRDIIRVIYEGPSGSDKALDARRERLRRYLRSLPASGTVIETVPSPLPAAFWQRALRGSAANKGPLVSALLTHRNASLLYYGLLGADAGTRAFLASQPSLVDDWLTSDRAAVFASHGSSIRVADGRVVVPGGAGAEPLWEMLVGDRWRCPFVS